MNTCHQQNSKACRVFPFQSLHVHNEQTLSELPGAPTGQPGLPGRWWARLMAFPPLIPRQTFLKPTYHPRCLLKDFGLGTPPGTSPDGELAGLLQAGHVVLAEFAFVHAHVFSHSGRGNGWERREKKRKDKVRSDEESFEMMGRRNLASKKEGPGALLSAEGGGIVSTYPT